MFEVFERFGVDVSVTERSCDLIGDAERVSEGDKGRFIGERLGVPDYTAGQLAVMAAALAAYAASLEEQLLSQNFH